MTPKSGIYCHKYEDKIFYIGQSVNIKKRKQDHLYLLRNNKHRNKHLQNAFNKYSGIEICVPIEYVNDVGNLTRREVYWINKLKPSCNIKLPIDLEHYCHSATTKRKMSKRQTGELNHSYGKLQAPEHRDKISIALKEFYANKPHHSKGKRGRVWTDEQRREFSKIRQALPPPKRKPLSNQTKVKIATAIKKWHESRKNEQQTRI